MRVASERITFIEPLSLPKLLFHAPDAEQDVAVDAVFLLDRREQCLPRAAFICLPVSMRIGVTALARYCEVVEVNSGWFLASLRTAGIGLGDAGEGAVEQRPRNARLPWPGATGSR